VRTICLPSPASRLATGQRLFAAGFGRTLEAAKSAIKQKIQLPVYDQNRCRSKFLSKKVDITQNHLCAGGELNRDTCDGDSGGPLMRFDTKWILEGVTSFGDSRCGREDLPGVYTRVNMYLDWVRNTMRP
jgi:secreted trypsin-like serine protease